MKLFLGELRLGLRRFCIGIRVVIERGRLKHELGLLEGQQLRRLLLGLLVVELTWLVNLGILNLLGLMLLYY